MSSFDQFLQIPSRSTLFVGDLSYFCTEEHLKRLFAPYGASVNGMPTVSAEIKRGKYGDSLMHGFVYLSSVEAADLAIQDLNNKKFMGRYMRVSWASPHIANAEPRPRESWSQVHVTFSTPFLDLFVTEEFLEEIFSAFGTVADVTVKRHNRNTTVPPSHSGYAFVYFYELPPAARSVQRFAEMAEVNNVRLMCNLPHVIRDKHEKPFYARNESRPSGGIPRGMPRPMTYNKPAGGPVPPYNYPAHHAMPPVDHYYGVPGRGPVPYGAPAEFDYGMPRKTPSQRFPGELDLGYIGRNPEFSNEMAFAADKRRGDVPPNGWHSPSSAPPSREALMSANAQNSGELSLGSWSSLSHSNSLNFTGSSTPIGQQHKSIVPPSDGLLSFNAPVVPGSYKVTPPGAEDGIAGVNSLGSFPMNLDNLQPLEG